MAMCVKPIFKFNLILRSLTCEFEKKYSKLTFITTPKSVSERSLKEQNYFLEFWNKN